MARATVATDETTTTTSTWLDLATVGPTFTVPSAGDYLVRARSRNLHSGANALMAIGVAVGASTPANDAFAYGASGAVANREGPHASVETVMPGLTAAAIIRVRYLMGADVAGTAHWINRQLYVQPVRVS